MDSARIGTDSTATGLDGELLALELSLGSARHPLPWLLRRRVLDIATGICARAPAPARLDVNARLRAVLRRHGISRNDLRPR